MDGLAIAASLEELRPAVEGAFVRNVYQPNRNLVILRVSGSPEPRVLISPKAASMHLTQLDIPNPQRPSNFAMLLRKHLRGGRVTAVRQHELDRIVTFDVERRIGTRTDLVRLIAELAGLRGNLLLVRDEQVLGTSRRDDRNRPGGPYVPLSPQPRVAAQHVTIDEIEAFLSETEPDRAIARRIEGVGRETARDMLAAAHRAEGGVSLAEELRAQLDVILNASRSPEGYFDPARDRATYYLLPPPAESFPTFSEALDRADEQAGVAGGGGEAGGIRRRVLRELGRKERTAEKLREWLEGATEEEKLRHRANLLLTYQSELPDSASEVDVEDPESGESLSIRLDPSLRVVENAQRIHHRAKRLRRGRPHVEERLRRIEGEIVALRAELTRIDEGTAGGTGSGVRAASKREHPEGIERAGKRFLIEGFAVLVGRSASENDRLLREASPDDVWMHVRGAAGAHVVVRRGGRRAIPDDVLRKAAGLAAHHSNARDERRVTVTMAAAKHVRKPKSAPAGLVIVDSEDTLTVDPGLREWEWTTS